MSSLFSCFGKKGTTKKTGKEPKEKKNKRKSKSDQNDSLEAEALVPDERKPPLENEGKELNIAIPDIIEEHGTKEPQSPLIKELEEKLQERREKDENSAQLDKAEKEKTQTDDIQDADKKEDGSNVEQNNSKKDEEKTMEEADNTVTVNEDVTSKDNVEEKSDQGNEKDVKQFSEERNGSQEEPIERVISSPVSSTKSFDFEIEQMKKDFEFTKEENAKLRDFISKLEQEATKDVKDMRDQIEHLQTKINELERTNKDLKTSEEKVKAECSRLKDERNSLEGNNEQEVRMLHVLNDRENILSAFDQLTKMCMFLEPRLDKIESYQLNHKNNKTNDVIPKIAKIGEEQNTLKDDVNEMVKNVQQLECRVIRLEVEDDNSQEKAVSSEKLDEFASRLEEMEEENDKLCLEIQEMKESVEKKSRAIERLESEKAGMSVQVYAFMSDLEKYKAKLDDLQVTLGEKEAELENSHRACAMAEENRKIQAIKMQTLSNQYKNKEGECKKLESQLKELQSKHAETVQKLQENSQTKQNGNHHSKPVPVMDAESDCSGVLSISERFYTELYGGLWKEAFDRLTNSCKRDEKKSLQILMDFCTEAYLHCRRIARQQLDTVCTMLQNPSSSHTRGSIVRRGASAVSIFSFLQKQSPADRLPQPLRHHLLEFRKTPSREFLDSLYDDFLNQLDFQKSRHLRSFHMKEVNEIAPYVNKCLALSWEMVVQDPPMYLQFKVRHGTEVDTERFVFYSHPGNMVDYLVWPALLREENGAVLQKGVVQAVSPRP